MQIQDLISESAHFDIWRYSSWLPSVSNGDRISDHKEELSPLEQKNEKLWIKHEDRQPLGSHKGRSLALQLSLLQQARKRRLVLSSSGNAAIACHELTYTDDTVLLVAPTIDQGKLARLLQVAGKGKIIITPHARAFAHYLATKYQYTDLRPSQDQAAIDGLMTLGFELVEQLHD
ncbi:pyridoxal-phosphate dependent enzyme, partial [Candidatus Gracilibacteria bacterium]|nr:pyridoxal-phosphate dependent enzyme [Candidatus Gracilibacteria bacterium]